MNKSLFQVAFKHYFIRLIRDPFGLLIFTVLPIILIAILSTVYGRGDSNEIYVQGYNMATTHIGMGMNLMFLFNGGVYILHYLNNDFIKTMKWRLKSTPCPTYILAFAATVSCMLFMALQGLLVIAITGLFMKAYWSNLIITILVVLLVSTFSSFFSIIIFLLTKSLSLSETFSWVTAWIMAALSGLMFDLPNTPFFDFMRVYGTPFALAQTAIKSSGFLAPSNSILLMCIGILVAINLFMGIIIINLGRRKIN